MAERPPRPHAVDPIDANTDTKLTHHRRSGKPRTRRLPGPTILVSGSTTSSAPTSPSAAFSVVAKRSRSLALREAGVGADRGRVAHHARFGVPAERRLS